MKRKILFLIIVLGLGLILPVSQAKAFDPLIGAAVAAAIAVFAGWILHLVSFMTAGLVASASATLQQVLYHLPFKYTSGGIIDVGWPIIRDLTNMLLVIILVFIGLSVALRLRDYGAKKTLISLVTIALLINFTPVIIGLIVDASNIVMNFFLKDLNPGAYWERHLAIQRAVLPQGWELLNPLKHMENTLAALMIVVMDLIVFGVLSMYTLLFLTRYLAIWILVILSPLAFASYILPATRKYWSQWWSQLSQWCIIGIAGAFFLYLGSHLFKWVEQLNFASEGVSWGIELSVKLIPLVMMIIFYIIGMTVAFSTSAMGAKQITAGFKRGYKVAGKVAGVKALGGIASRYKAGVKALNPLKQNYQAGRGLGFTRKESFDATAKGGWRDIKKGLGLKGGKLMTIGGRPIRDAAGKAVVTPDPKGLAAVGAVAGTLAKRTGATAKGSLKAIRDVAKAGALAGLGIKLPKKKKGEKCPQCKKPLPNNADYCPGCGFKF